MVRRPATVPAPPPNRLYFGDNLGFLKRVDLFPDECVDLFYLDPPFNSKRDYSVIFKEADGTASASQIQAFEDTWEWNRESLALFDEIVAAAPPKLVETLSALHRILGPNPMLAYLVHMGARLTQMHRALKPSGSLYLHCDPTASHYLKIVLDAIFGPKHFLAEIVWQRTNSRSTAGKWPRVHDTILTYSKSADFVFTPTKSAADSRKTPHTLITGDDGQKYQTYELTAPGITKSGDSGKPWKDYDPARFGRHWANGTATREAWDAAGLIHWPRKKGGWPRRRAAEPFVPEDREVTVGDVWTDIDRINQTAAERLGYPTQKPVELLKRIVAASSAPGGVVCDPFCGCGTTIDAVETLNRENPGDTPRRWIGIDLTHLAVGLIRSRLAARFPDEPRPAFAVEGEPKDPTGARFLALDDAKHGRYNFQYWALGLIGARPRDTSGAGGKPKKGADRGIDGVRYFNDGGDKATPRALLVQVKSGKVQRADVATLNSDRQRDGAPMAVLISLEDTTKPMRDEALAAGTYLSPWDGERYPAVQLLTIAELLDERENSPNPRCLRIPYNQAGQTLRQPARAGGAKARQDELDLD